MFWVNNRFMKKLIIFLFILSLVLGGFCFSGKAEQIFDVEGVDRVCFVSSERYDGEFESVQCGEKFFNFCTFEEAKSKVALVKSSDAVQFYAQQCELAAMLKRIKFQELSSEEVEGIEVCYGYSPCYPCSIMFDGKKVNVQIAKAGGRVIVGFPMIMTGF